jgi:HAD superfamily hydrolase (TIGR01509 family)
MIQAILWDNDGVLVNTEPLFFEANRRVLAAHGVTLTADQFTEISLRQGRSPLRRMITEQGWTPDRIQQQLRPERDACYAELLQQRDCALPGVQAVLRQLHGTVRMGIVTSSQRRHFELIHRRSGLLEYMDFAVTLEEYARSKPAPDPYLAGIERTGCPAEACLAVEDSVRGLQAAQAAGLRCAVIPQHLSGTRGFEPADAVLPHIEAVPALLERW